MFFIIAGIQPKKTILDENPRMCPSCGLYQAYLKRIDQYFSIFFLPLLRIKKGTPFLECERCAHVSSWSGEELIGPHRRFIRRCPSCGRAVDRDYSFCPFCGKKL